MRRLRAALFLFAVAVAMAARSGSAAEPLPTLAVERAEALTDPSVWPQALALRFHWPRETGAAAFRLGEHSYLLFDQEGDAGLVERLTELAPELAELERLPAEGATALRFRASPLAEPRLTRDGDTWSLDLKVQPLPPQEGELAAQEMPVFLAAIEGGRRLLAIADPLGGKLFALPLPRAGNGLAEVRRFPGFELLPTAQGLLLRRLSERALTADTGRALAASAAPTGAPQRGRLLEQEDWPLAASDFTALRRSLEGSLAKAPPTDRTALRLALARLYLAQSLAVEAESVLAPGLETARDPQAVLLAAIARLLRGETKGVVKLLDSPGLREVPEGRLWQGMLAAQVGDWPVAAARLAEGESLMSEYPRPLRLALQLAAAEARLEVGDLGGAMLLLAAAEQAVERRVERARLDFLRGRHAILNGAEEEGLAIWRDLAARESGFAAARARLGLVEHGLAGGALSQAAAIDALERLRLAWHGDAFEAGLLLRLSDLYLAEGRPREALRHLRQLASRFPDHPGAADATVKMRGAFVASFLGTGSAQVSPLVALALYEEFRELTPAGAEGARLVLALGERLIAVDLLDRAAELLEELVAAGRLAPDLRAGVGARLAELQLARQAPQPALDALEATAAPAPAPEVLAWRQRLAARALAALDRTAEALAMLEKQEGEGVEELRLQLLWRNGDWSGAAEVLARLLPASPPGDVSPREDVSRRVLDLAVALTLAGREEELERLRSAWAPAMALGPHAEVFALVAGERRDARAVSIAAELARAEQAENFLAAYRAGGDL